jgi:hypothetical protein
MTNGLFLGQATAAKSGTSVTVNIGGTIYTIDVARDLTVASGDQLLIGAVGDRYIAIQRLGATTPTAPVDPPPSVPSKPVTTSGSKSISPVQTISRQGSKWRNDNDDVYQGEYGGQGLHVGCAFYGNRFDSLSGATVTRTTLKVKRKSGGGITAAQDTTLWTLSNSTKPSGAPTRLASTDGPNLRWGQSTTFTLPNSFGQALVDGTAGGLAVYESDGSPYVILDGKSEYSASFTVTINWTRN